MPIHEDVVFIRRRFPSANMVLIKGAKPVLLDTGFGSDLESTLGLLREHGVEPESLELAVNSHYHSDHSGGNFGLQSRYGVPIAAHTWEAAMVNRRDAEACSARWLDQPVEPYKVDRVLEEGDVIDTGNLTLEVLHTPGHTLGHISLYMRGPGLLLCGDAVHADDVCWINFFREGAGALTRTMASIERLRTLGARWSCSGHGPDTENPSEAFERALQRYEKWLGDPEKAGWHACKRIFSFKLMLLGGLDRTRVESYLLGCPWFRDYSAHVFRVGPEDFVAPLLAEMIRSKAAVWEGDRLDAGALYTKASSNWPSAPTDPSDWPS